MYGQYMVWYAYVLGLRPSGSPQAVTWHAVSVPTGERKRTQTLAQWERVPRSGGRGQEHAVLPKTVDGTSASQRMAEQLPSEVS